MEKAREEGLGVKFRPTFASPLPAPMRQENGRLGHGDEENQFTPRLVWRCSTASGVEPRVCVRESLYSRGKPSTCG